MLDCWSAVLEVVEELGNAEVVDNVVKSAVVEAELLVVELDVIDGKGSAVVTTCSLANKLNFGFEVVNVLITGEVWNGEFCLDFENGKLPRSLENLEKALNCEDDMDTRDSSTITKMEWFLGNNMNMSVCL